MIIVIFMIGLMFGFAILSVLVLLYSIATGHLLWYYRLIDKLGILKGPKDKIYVPKGLYDTTKFVFKNSDLWPITIRTVNGDGYGDVVLLEYLIEVFNAGYIARWNRDTCCFELELPKDASMGG